MAPSAAPAHLSPRPLVPHAVVASSFPETSPERLEAAVRASFSLGARAGGTSTPLPTLGLPLLIPHLLPASLSPAWGTRPQAPMAWAPRWQLLQAWRRGWGAWPHSRAAGSLCCQPAQHPMSATCSEAASPSSTPVSPAISHLLDPWRVQRALPPASTALAKCPRVQEPVTSRSPATPPQTWASPEQLTPHHWPRSTPTAAHHPSPTPWWTYPSC